MNLRTFRSFLDFEFRRSLSWRNSWVLGLFLVLASILVCTGISQYKDILENKQKFQEIEKEKVKQWQNYEMYGGYGIYIYFIPAPLSALFNSTNLFTELIGHIDVGERANIYNSFKGKEIFSQKPGKLWDFAGFVLLLGSFMALYYGYESLRDREYLKFLSSLFGHRKVFGFIIGTRMIFLCLFIFFVTLFALGLMWIRGISISADEIKFIRTFFFMMVLMMVFFFSLGTICGSIRNSRKARFFIILLWIGSVYFIPALINKVIENISDKIEPNFSSELTKVQRLMSFEEKASKEMEKLKKEKKLTRENAQKVAERYLKSGGFQEVQASEIRLNEETKGYVKWHQTFSLLYPSTYYLSINNEISSRGYKSIIDFHKYAKNLKDKFMDFYIKRKFKHRIGQPVEPFVKRDENIFKGVSRLPWNFWLGLFVTLLWIGLVLKWSFALYQKSLFSVPKEVIRGLSDLAIDVEQGKANAVLSSSETIRQHLFNVLSGQNKEFAGRVLLEGRDDIVPGNKGIEFVYICHPDDMPADIKVGHFLSFAGRVFEIPKEKLESIKIRLNLNEIGKKSFGELKDEQRDTERGHLLLEAACFKSFKESGVYVINNLNKGMPSDFVGILAKKLEELKRQSVLYLSNDVFVSKKISDSISTLKSDARLMSVRL